MSRRDPRVRLLHMREYAQVEALDSILGPED
jgi:hypothetical protein